MRSWDENSTDSELRVIVCIECARASATARGWKAYRIDEPTEDDPPGVAFYCSECAERKYG